MAGGVDFPDLDGSEVRIGIIKARWHEEVGDSLVAGAKAAFTECKVQENNIVESEVPGAFELPLAARYLALSGTVDVILPVGVLIKGDTTHFEVISESVTSGLMNVGLQTGVPVIFGVLTCMNNKQAVDRSTGKDNHGIQWGKAAVEMALLRNSALGGPGKKQLFFGFGNTNDEKAPSKKSTTKIGFDLPHLHTKMARVFCYTSRSLKSGLHKVL
eukprot:CAMPEP_0119308550 /NCGR_PEP_ID=MMETSP1333-20130426/11532_1 /TAXON_ID=418940 /ORGANISM="Scyphosphaera apsteinii, Strain RCC1455" /LENGTH=214 /DNA_ID=CAMNT_0007312353 /DNA_START=155 /DNA_END=800 /DNA_ORIENTATION=-